MVKTSGFQEAGTVTGWTTDRNVTEDIKQCYGKFNAIF